MTSTTPTAHLPRTLWRSVAALLLLGTLGLWLAACGSPASPTPTTAYCAQLSALTQAANSTSSPSSPAKLKAQLKSGEAIVAKLVATAPTAALRSDAKPFARAMHAYYAAAAATGYRILPTLLGAGRGALHALTVFGSEVYPWQKAHCPAPAT